MSLKDLEDKEYTGAYDFKSDPMGSPKPNPVSHVAYGYATQLYILDLEGKVVKIVAAHDVGRVINPLSAHGQVEGGAAMALGYGLTEDFPLKDGIPQVKLGTLGLWKATQMPTIETHLIGKNHAEVAYGAKGIGEIVAVMGAPACQNAYYKKDGNFRYRLPLENTYYHK
jgi:CO/xanthine dehydrogenase Mo-binding subunit